MAKGNKTQPAVTLAGNTVTTSAVPAVVLAVKQGANFRGARAAWYAVLTQYNGQPAAAYLAHCAANPPSLPTKGKHAGTAEKPTGWLAWFVRNGYATLS
jgi:AICAR transformylase/IMP cyclohydrolase PurH